MSVIFSQLQSTNNISWWAAIEYSHSYLTSAPAALAVKTPVRYECDSNYLNFTYEKWEIVPKEK